MATLTANNASTQITTSITAAAVNFSVTSGQGTQFPSPAVTNGVADHFWATLTNGTTLREIVQVTARSGDSFTVVRGQDGTTAQSWPAGTVIECRPCAALFNDKVDKSGFVTGLITPVFMGVICMWSGAISAIPAHWNLCNGQNGTPNLMDQFIVGAGNTYAVGATGGATTVTLSVSNMPSHSHTLTDPGHNHALNDPGHNHSVYDPGHAHLVYYNGSGGTTNGFAGPISASNLMTQTSMATVGIGINPNNSGITLSATTTGITMATTGSGTAFSILPSYYALAYIMYTG